MNRTGAVVIGAGQAGLAMSRCLTDRGIAHVVLERGAIAERWRRERWDSLRLLTPNWQTRLPGFCYDGADPDGFMSAADVVRFLSRYATTFAAPVHTHTPVRAVERDGGRFRVRTERADWQADAVIVATGYCDLPLVPQIAQGLSRSIDQVTPRKYRSPERLRSGNVLVVGAAATGVQIAQELRLAGREVILAVGQHVRVPRAYRGRDILWWLDRMGVFDATDRDVFDVEISRDQSSFQLVGRDDHATIDLGILQDLGVHIVGRLRHLDRHRASFADDLVVSAVAADVKLASLLKRIDAFVATNRLDVPAAPPFEPLWPRMTQPAVTLNLRERGITSVVWATGFRRAYPWLRVPGALDRHGEIRHRHGVCEIPGLYVLGLPFLRHRNSAFIDGVGRDAMSLTDHLRRYLDERRVA